MWIVHWSNSSRLIDYSSCNHNGFMKCFAEQQMYVGLHLLQCCLPQAKPIENDR
jgi:hypothetical protein